MQGERNTTRDWQAPKRLKEPKADVQARRAEKKSNQKTFGDERRRQIASHRKTVEGGKAADVRGTISLR